MDNKTQILHVDVFLETAEIISAEGLQLPGHLIMKRGQKNDRAFYISLPPSKLIAWTLRGGLKIADLPYGAYVRALVGADRFNNSNKLPGNEHLAHLKITILEVTEEKEGATSLAGMIANAPENPKYASVG